uniref:hypothetical protein n=1 Tax=Dialister sp. TaxID=1955814 RepID=UPI004024DDD1
MEKRLRPAFPPFYAKWHSRGNGGLPVPVFCLPIPRKKNSPLRESFFIQRMLKLFCDLSYNACAYGT